tara:strand:- start:197 stop:2206 length:2010 start_codon:yes stop_codon:yes gene_type:complete
MLSMKAVSSSSTSPFEGKNMVQYKFEKITDLAAAIASEGSTPFTGVIDTSLTISADLEIPQSFKIIFVDEGELNINTSVLVKIASPSNISAPPAMKIKSGSGNLVFAEGGEVHMGWFGTTQEALQEATNSLRGCCNGGDVLIPKVTINMSTSTSIKLYGNVNLRGQGKISTFAGGTPRTAPMFELIGASNTTIEGLSLSGASGGGQGQIEITGSCENILIQKCYFHGGHAGIWINPNAGDKINNVTFLDNYVHGHHSIYVGNSELGGIAEEEIRDLKIISNFCTGGVNESSDGIKLTKSVKDVLIQGNICSENEGDGIDLFASGDRVVIINNICEGNGVQGIDIKTDETNYPPYTRGKNRQVIVKANILRANNESGIKVISVALDGEWPYFVQVVDNQIYENQFYGIWCSGRYIDIISNHVFLNCQDEDLDTNSGGIQIQGNDTKQVYSEYITVAHNHSVNNGKAAIPPKTFPGINITNYSRNVRLTGNFLANDETLPNDGLQTIGINIADGAQDIFLKNNQCINQDKNINIGTAGIQGETVSCKIGNVPETDASNEYPLFSAPSDICLLSVFLVNASKLEAGSDRDILEIVKDPSPPTGGTSILTLDLNTTTVEAFVATSMGTLIDTSPRYLSKGQVLGLKRTNGSSGQGLTEAVIVLNYITYGTKAS